MPNLLTRTVLNETASDTDVIHIVDVSDSTDDPEGTSKQITVANLLGSKANTSHEHSASDITSGTLAVARGGTNWDSSSATGYVKVDSGIWSAAKYNLSASTAPTTGDDVNSGYVVSSLWIDTTADKVYQCVDSSASAAIWKELSPTAGSGDGVVSGVITVGTNNSGADYECTGVEDEIQIQNAVDEAELAGGGTVKILIGDYYLTKPVSIDGSYINIVGEGPATYLEIDNSNKPASLPAATDPSLDTQHPATSQAGATGACFEFWSDSCHSCSISNLRIYDSATKDTADTGRCVAIVDEAYDISVHNLWLSGGTDGVRVYYGANKVNISHIYTYNTEHGIAVQDLFVDGNGSGEVNITNCYIDGSDRGSGSDGVQRGLWLNSSARLNVSNCIFKDIYSTAINCSTPNQIPSIGGHAINIDNCVVYDTTGDTMVGINIGLRDLNNIQTSNHELHREVNITNCYVEAYDASASLAKAINFEIEDLNPTTFNISNCVLKALDNPIRVAAVTGTPETQHVNISNVQCLHDASPTAGANDGDTYFENVYDLNIVNMDSRQIQAADNYCALKLVNCHRVNISNSSLEGANNSGTGDDYDLSVDSDCTSLNLSNVKFKTGRTTGDIPLGWQSFDNTLTYSSGDITVSGDITGIVDVGDKLRYTQGGSTIYKYIISASHSGGTTTLEVAPAASSGAITDPYLSKENNPSGFTHWFPYTFDTSNFTKGDGSGTSRFSMTGKRVDYIIDFTWGSTTSASGVIRLGLPTDYNDTNLPTNASVGSGRCVDNSGTPYLCDVVTADAEANKKYVQMVTNSGDVNATVPFTWTTSDIISIKGSYEL